jgi:hypothetical protein
MGRKNRLVARPKCEESHINPLDAVIGCDGDFARVERVE